MTSHATTPSPTAVPTPAGPVYTESELYDSPEDLARWPLLAPLLRTWQMEVWERDHSELRGCWHYDQQAIQLQQWHRLAVILAAITGTAAVVFAILQLGMEHRICGAFLADFFCLLVGSTLGSAAMQEKAATFLMYLEAICILAAVVTIVFSAFLSLDHRWRELRFKAEHYRMLKFRYLHDAARWLAASEEERGLHLFKHLAQIHSATRGSIKEWIHWKQEVLPTLESPDVQPDAPVAVEVADYFRQRRLIPQQRYFQMRGHQLHNVEKIVRWIGPGLFFASIVCALAHATLHVFTHEESQPHESVSPVSAIVLWAFALALLAAILPVAAAGIRTWRGAFEFGRNSLRFESMAHHLQHLLGELEKAQSPEAMLAILRRGEYAMESEHRAWMRLMMEAEWFG